MKRLVLAAAVLSALALALPAHAEPYPDAAGFVVDTADAIPPAAEAVLEGELRSFSDRTTNQIAVAVINDLDGETVEDYARELFNQWGVGQADKNNGVLILIAVHDRRTRIQVGYGLESVLTPAVTEHVLAAQLAPRARTGNIAGAVTATERSLRAVLGDSALTRAPTDESSSFGGGTYEDRSSGPVLEPGDVPAVDVVEQHQSSPELLWLVPLAVVVAVGGIAATGLGRGRRSGYSRSTWFGSGFGSGGGGFGGGGSSGGEGGGGFGGGSSGDGGSSGSF